MSDIRHLQLIIWQSRPKWCSLNPTFNGAPPTFFSLGKQSKSTSPKQTTFFIKAKNKKQYEYERDLMEN